MNIKIFCTHKYTLINQHNKKDHSDNNKPIHSCSGYIRYVKEYIIEKRKFHFHNQCFSYAVSKYQWSTVVTVMDINQTF